MHLKSLKLVGFKSFADRTRLEFRPGVTVIVGPNGSGKSNIVDAVAWVMGSQSPKALRTGKMDEVIFAGTATRPGLGRAEVTLVLDNTSGLLPLDLTEVSITRRLYRDGSSDYEINGVECRLLDIQELLSDSGVGRRQHVIIGQGQIDGILNATPEEHRGVIEEAAGILKHRLRKEKAIRRLERTEGDVLRLRDLLGEVARQIRPLRRQAEAAARYESLRAEVRALRLYLGGEELRRIGRRRHELAAEEGQLAASVAEAEQELRDLGSALAILRKAAGEVGEALDRDSAAAARVETTVERLRRIVQVAHERHRATAARLEGADGRRRDLLSEQEELEAALASLGEEELAAGGAAEAAERRFRSLEDEERSLADQEAMTAEGAVAVVRGDLASLEAADERDRRELSSVERRLELLGEQLRAERTEIERLNEEIRRTDAEVGTAQKRYDEAGAARRRDQAAWEQAETSHNEGRVRLSAAQARLDALEHAATGLADPEGRAIVEGSPGARASVAARLDVPAALAPAVDAALGPFADAVAFGSPEEAAGAVAALKGQGRGGVPLVHPGSGERPVAREVAAALGIEALVDLLGPAHDRSLADTLLGDVVVVEGWQTALQVVARYPDVRVVTPEGDLVTAFGIRVAQPDGASPAMIEAAAAEVEAAETELARRASRLTHTRRAFEASRSRERQALEGLEALEARLAGASEALGRSRRAVAAIEEELRALDDRRAALVAAGEGRAQRRAALVERLAALEGEEAERQRAWEQLAERRREVSAARESARAAWQDATAAYRATVERRTITESRLQAVRSALEREGNPAADPGRLERLATIEERGRQALEALRAHLEALRDRQADLRSRAGETGRRLGEVQSAHEAIDRRMAGERERLGRMAVEQAELRVRVESVAEALRREVDASEEEALAAPAPAAGDRANLEELLAAKDAELRRMGPVNPLAAEEHAVLSERADFLSGQLEDLERSRGELRKVISALDDEIEARFLAAFEEVAAAYEANFRVLFPGGRGRLRLTDPDNPLTSGLEIEAQPYGKKVAKMSLLSGGERSLAALAFLFGVFAARPSPFYVLDEVEAALDDANLRRFLRLLGTFKGASQLIVVTHQQQTMEAADVLYGVTMEPGGSSRVVAKPVTEAVVVGGPPGR